MEYDQINIITPPNLGWVEKKLNKDEIDYVWKCIESRKLDSYKNNLAGNIYESNLLNDKGNFFWSNTLMPLCQTYEKTFGNLSRNVPIDEQHSLHLSSWWVNYQKQNEFNPLHYHVGVYSFAIWLKIPFSFETQNLNKISSTANSQTISVFEFSYTNILGQLMQYPYQLSEDDEGMMVMFPSSLHHQVYPFYNCEKTRVSVSGNISLRLTSP